MTIHVNDAMGVALLVIFLIPTMATTIAMGLGITYVVEKWFRRTRLGTCIRHWLTRVLPGYRG